MPYVSESVRDALNDGLAPSSPGMLNYAITKLVDDYLGGAITYHGINEAIGVLECAKLELYRRIAVPYEDRKIKENGDVYNPENIL